LGPPKKGGGIKGVFPKEGTLSKKEGKVKLGEIFPLTRGKEFPQKPQREGIIPGKIPGPE